MPTDGAAQLLGEMQGVEPTQAADLDYVRFMYERLGVDPNERRYATPADQPADVRVRIEGPRASRS